MPFLPPLIGAATAFFSTALGKIVLSVGLNLLTSAFRKKPQTGSKQEVGYGVEPVPVIFGKVITAGTFIPPTITWGKANRNAEQVFVLSAWRITGVTRVFFDGEWRSLTPVTSVVSGVPEYQVAGVSAQVFVRVYLGSMSQVADPYLTTNGGTKWPNTNHGKGLAYVVVRSIYNQEHLQQPAQLKFEVEGAPLYDPRKDTTAGGAGAHRFNDPDTWTYASGVGENPALQVLALKRGLFWGTERIIGQGDPASRIPFEQYALAANICDETVGGQRRYRSSIIATADEDGTVGAAIDSILPAMAGTWVDRFGGGYPVAGAARPSQYTLNDDHVHWGMPVSYNARRPRSDRANAIAGTYLDPAMFYEAQDYGERSNAPALAIDGERLFKPMSFGTVIYREQAQRLADIYLRQNSFGGRFTGTLTPEWQGLKPFDRLTFTTTKFGGFTKTFTVASVDVRGPNDAAPYSVDVELQEDSNTVFDASTYTGPIPPVLRPPTPIYLQELAGFDAIPTQVQGSGGTLQAAFRIIWQAVDDETVDKIELRWRPDGSTGEYSRQIVDADATAIVVTDGIVASTASIASSYDISHKLLTVPKRVTNWASPITRTAPSGSGIPPIDFDGLADDVKEWVADSQRDLKALKDGRLDWLGVKDGLVGTMDIIRRVKAFGRNTARIEDVSRVSATADEAFAVRITKVEASLANVDPDAIATSLNALGARVTATEAGLEAQATAITAVEAKTDAGTASGLVGWNAVSAPAGVLARFSIVGKATSGGVERTGGAFLDVTSTAARWVFVADQFAIQDGTSQTFPFVVDGGQVYIETARIRNLTISNITLGGLNYEAFPTNEIVLASSISLSRPLAAPPGAWTTVRSVNLANPRGNGVQFIVEDAVIGGASGSPSATTTLMWRLQRTSGAPKTIISGGITVTGSYASSVLNLSRFDAAPGSGTNTYAFQVMHSPTTVGSSLEMTGNISMIWSKP